MDTKIFQVAYVPASENYIDYGDVFRDENGKIHFASAHHGYIEKWEKQLTYIVDTSMRQDSIQKGDKAIMLKTDSVCYGDIIKCKSNKNVLRELGWCKIIATGVWLSTYPFHPENVKWDLPKILDVDIAYIAQRELTEVELEIDKEDIKISSTGFVRMVRTIQIPEIKPTEKVITWIALTPDNVPDKEVIALRRNENFDFYISKGKIEANDKFDTGFQCTVISENQDRTEVIDVFGANYFSLDEHLLNLPEIK